MDAGNPQSQMWKSREEYEALLPPAVRESMARRRENGFDVPFRPVPDDVLRAWQAQGPRLTQAQIQWGYAKRDAAERRGAPQAQAGGMAPPQRPAAPGAAGQPQQAPPAAPAMGRPGAAPRPAQAGGGRPAPLSNLDAELAGSDAFMRDAQQLADFLASGNNTIRPGSKAWDHEGGMLQFRNGMTIDEYEAAKRNQDYRVRMIRSGVHPSQELDLGTAEQQNAWNKWVQGSLERMRRYAPETVPPVRIDMGPSWRERAAEGKLTPEQQLVYEKIEARQRARKMIERYGQGMTQETFEQIISPGDPGGNGSMGYRAYMQNLLDRVREKSDENANRRITQLLNDPSMAQGFVYRTMSTGTPEERSALAAAVGSPIVYSTEMQNAFPAPAAPAAPAAAARPVPVGDMTNPQLLNAGLEAIEQAVTDGNENAALQQALDLAASMNTNLPEGATPASGEDLYVVAMLRGRLKGRDYSANPIVVRVLGQKAAQGLATFMEFVSRAGYTPEAARAMYERLRPAEDSGPKVAPSAQAALDSYNSSPQSAF